MSLPLATREQGKGGAMPSKESLFLCMQVATTPEAAQYFYTQFEARVKEARMQAKVGPLLGAVAQFSESVQAQSDTSARPWTGDTRIEAQTIETFKFENLQQNLASNAAGEIAAKDITFDYAISDQSQLIRGYSADGNPLDKEEESAMDILFNAWLAANKMISLGGVIYQYQLDEKTKEIKPRKDAQGEPIRVDPQELRTMMASDEADGFKQYMQGKNAAIQMTSQAHQYPEQHHEATPEPVSSGMDGGR